MEENPTPAPVRRTFPTVGDIFALLGIVLGIQIVVGLLLTVAAGFTGWKTAAASPEALGRFNCLMYLAGMSLSLIGALLYRRKRGGTGPVVSFSTARLNPMMLLWAAILLFAVGIVIEPLLNLLPNPQPELGRGPWTLLMTVIFAPVLEELLCRGVVLGSLRAKYGVVVAWLGSSLFFGILHLSPMLVVNACIIGLILGYIYIATESIWASMLLHAFNNAVAYAMLAVGGDQLLLIDMIGNRTAYGALYIVALFVAIFSAWKIWQAIRAMKAAEKNSAEA